MGTSVHEGKRQNESEGGEERERERKRGFSQSYHWF